MSKRKIINIDEEKCNGCGLCIPNCPEGALQVIDGKARLISDLFCDGLGACIGHCPQDAITIEEREAEAYDERKVMVNVAKQGKSVIKAHKIEVSGPGHGHEHGPSGCPGSKMLDMRKGRAKVKRGEGRAKAESSLSQWPVQIRLVPPHAPYFKDADILIAADCVPFAYADFHEDLLKGKQLLVGCPKLDDIELYRQKIAQILKENDIRSVTYAHMEVPCCFGLVGVIQSAIDGSGKKISFKEVTITIRGKKLV